MQCLYCKKKLGLFASKKHPFCSETHEVAYNDEQAGLAMRRVMDPLFTERPRKAPLQMPAGGNLEPPVPAVKKVDAAAPRVAPAEPAPARVAPVPAPPPLAPRDQEPKRAAPAAEASAFRPIVVPATYQSFLPQVRPVAAPSNLAAPGSSFGFELSAAQPRLPEGATGLIDDHEDHHEDDHEADQKLEAVEAEAAVEAEMAETAISHRLHPALEQQKPDWIEDQPQPAFDGSATPVNFGTAVSRSLPVALSIGAEPAIPETAKPAAAELQTGEVEPAGQEPAPAPLAERLWTAALGPQPSDGREEHTRHLESALDSPPLALRYPYAYIALGNEDLDRAMLIGHAQAIPRWSAKAPSAPPWATDAAAQPTSPQLAPRFPEAGGLIASALDPKMTRLGSAAPGRLPVPRAVAAPNPPWKMLTGLREAPAKLRVPEPLIEFPVKRPVTSSMRFPVPPLETAGWKAPKCPPAQAAAVDLRTWVSPLQLPFWRALPETRVPSPAASERLRWQAAQVQPGPIKAEDARTFLQVRSPHLPVPAERRLAKASLVEFRREAQADRRLRYRPPGLLADATGFQRVRAASHIQIREPELRRSNSSDLPSATARLQWVALGMSPVVQPAGVPVPLRPTVRTPEWAA